MTVGIGLFLATAQVAEPAQARQAEERKPQETGNRYLFIVENSSAMERRDAALRQTLFELINTGVQGRMLAGDTFGIWTYNSTVDTRFPMQTWDPAARLDLGTRANTFLRGQGYRKRARTDILMEDLNSVIAYAGNITVVWLTDGQEKIEGTPFDREINKSLATLRSVPARQNDPLVVGLMVRGGHYVAFSVVSPGEAMTLPPPPERTRPRKETPPRKVETAATQTPRTTVTNAAPRKVTSIIMTRDGKDPEAPEAEAASSASSSAPVSPAPAPAPAPVSPAVPGNTQPSSPPTSPVQAPAVQPAPTTASNPAPASSPEPVRVPIVAPAPAPGGAETAAAPKPKVNVVSGPTLPPAVPMPRRVIYVTKTTAAPPADDGGDGSPGVPVEAPAPVSPQPLAKAPAPADELNPHRPSLPLLLPTLTVKAREKTAVGHGASPVVTGIALPAKAGQGGRSIRDLFIAVGLLAVAAWGAWVWRRKSRASEGGSYISRALPTPGGGRPGRGTPRTPRRGSPE